MGSDFTLQGESFGAAACFSRRPHCVEIPMGLRRLAGPLCFAPLERVKVQFREEDGPGGRIPKPTCCKCFVIEFHKKIKSITESNKALKLFN